MAAPNKFYEEITDQHLKDWQCIGRGAFGTIYRARHNDWRIDVAVKILNSNTSFTREELLKEARAMEEARFTYVLRLFGLFAGRVEADTKPAGFGSAAGSNLGLVMEFMENGTLSALRYRVPFVPWALRIRILHQVALGMNFLHSLKPPLLHLDLKPSNVLLDEELHVRVADFGLSKFKRGTTRNASIKSREEEEYGGTLEFMPPEAFTSVNYKPTPGTDVYSYGILMWSLLTGEDPYAHVPPGNMSSIIKSLIPQGQRPSTKELEGMTNRVLKLEDLIRLMKLCWHHNQDQRPSFRECSQNTEDAFSQHKPHIIAAVRRVQDCLMESSPNKTRVNSGTISKPLEHEDPLTSSYELEERFKTMRLEDFPHRQNEAAPFLETNREGKSGLHRSHSARIRKVRTLLSMLPIEAEESWMGWGNGVESTSWGLRREAIGWGCCGNCWVEMDSEGSSEGR
ncbi:receptor-interacting serine/threonine-protein kinase 3-like [Lacerta agilis]|uniref:receptor-interacting serine/threonine-protein kinase 3-like n=1 Tax=Lacerta agilis TaxID=80427 RepID=UPI001419CE2C|nr:receptor-interacting serine/threonine-protein kinase 3-like [Lacerta agilis]